MKVLLISTLYHPRQIGGAEKIAQVVSESLLGAGHQVVVVTTQPGPGVTVDMLNGVKVYYVGLKNLYWPHDGKRLPVLKPVWHAIDGYNPWMAAQLGQILQQEQPDLVNTHDIAGFSCAVWPLVKDYGIPLCHTLHGGYLLCPKATMFRNSRNCERQCGVCKAYRLPAKALSSRVDAVIGVSRHVLHKHLGAGYFKDVPVRSIIYNAVSDRHDFSRRVRRTRDKLHIGFVGGLVPGKGIEMLLSAVSELPEHCSLVVAGRGEPDYERQLRSRYDLPHIQFLGFVDPGTVYEQIDLLVVPSIWDEGLPTVVIEAYQYGIPVLVSDRGGLPEMVDDGRTGFIYRADDLLSLKDHLVRVNRLRDQLPVFAPAIRAILPRFQSSRMIADYLAVFDSCRAFARSPEPSANGRHFTPADPQLLRAGRKASGPVRSEVHGRD